MEIIGNISHAGIDVHLGDTHTAKVYVIVEFAPSLSCGPVAGRGDLLQQYRAHPLAERLAAR